MNAKIKVALTFIYFAIVGFAIDFFIYFSPFEFKATTSSVTSKTLAEACINGSIKGGGFTYFFSLILLLVMLVITIIISVKAFRQSDFGYGLFITSIILAVACLILAIVQLSIFTRIGYGSVDVDESSVTSSGGGEFIILYISSFEAAATALIAGISGIMGVREDSYSYHPKYPSKTTYQKTTYYNTSSTPKPVQHSTTTLNSFDVGDIIVCKYESGVTIYEVRDGMKVSSKIGPGFRLEILSLSPDKSVGNIKRLSDGRVFKDVSMTSFSVFKKASAVTQEQAEQTAGKVAPAPTPSPTPAPAPMDESKKIELLKEYKELLDSGIITQEEFDKKKKEILD